MCVCVRACLRSDPANCRILSYLHQDVTKVLNNKVGGAVNAAQDLDGGNTREGVLSNGEGKQKKKENMTS